MEVPRVYPEKKKVIKLRGMSRAEWLEPVGLKKFCKASQKVFLSVLLTSFVTDRSRSSRSNGFIRILPAFASFANSSGSFPHPVMAMTGV